MQESDRGNPARGLRGVIALPMRAAGMAAVTFPPVAWGMAAGSMAAGSMAAGSMAAGSMAGALLGMTLDVRGLAPAWTGATVRRRNRHADQLFDIAQERRLF